MNRAWDSGGANICVLGVPGEECEAEKIFGEIIAENILTLVEDTHLQI